MEGLFHVGLEFCGVRHRGQPAVQIRLVAAQGGVTAYRTVLSQGDIDSARRRLEQQLFAKAKKQVQDELALRTVTKGFDQLRLLTNDQLVKSTMTGFVLPTNLLNQQVPSITVEGGLVYTVFAYDAGTILEWVRTELLSHIPDGKRVIAETANLRNLDLRVFDYADDLSWIKATVELTATEQYLLDPLTPTGAKFAKKVREVVAGIPTADALRIVKNMPEIEKAEVHMWPPWSSVLPSIPSHINLSPQ